MLNIFNFLIFSLVLYFSLVSNIRNNSIMYLSLIELIWINIVTIIIFLTNFFDNINFIILIIFIFIIASIELTLILLYIYIKK